MDHVLLVASIPSDPYSLPFLMGAISHGFHLQWERPDGDLQLVSLHNVWQWEFALIPIYQKKILFSDEEPINEYSGL